MNRLLATVVFVSLAVLSTASAQRARSRDWPAITREARPWVRWWWQGSAVDRAGLTANLESLSAAGIGGVEITPIYGVLGEEARFIPYLSEPWVEMLEHTLSEARRLDLGVDMANATGWPFGGPWVDDDMAARTMSYRTWTIDAGQRITEPVRLAQTPLVRTARPLPQGRLQISDLAEPVTATPNLQALALEHVRYPRDLPLIAVVAYGDSGRVTDLTSRMGVDRTLEWTAAEHSTVYAVFPGWHGKLVERAAPGGEGFVIDHFSRGAIRSYLARFDRAFGSRPLPGLRAFFNDSYEVDDAPGQADWTPLLFDEFRKRRGYDVREHLPALFGRDTGPDAARVLADYRETISDLLLDAFTNEWAAWAHRRGTIVRDQAHGSPANLLDLYAASDIPETEGTEIPRFKWATSAGHVAGRNLVSAEAATWLNEHFVTTLADMRSAVDRFFVAGVNHVVYHGSAYSPPDAAWPGWQFYAAVELNPRTAWWDDSAALNQYVARTQAFLQSGHADQDVLLYFPFSDAVATRGRALLTHFGDANQTTGAEGFEQASTALQARGFTYDYISDRQLHATRTVRGHLVSAGGSSYAVLVVPPARYIPVETMERILELAREGASIVIWKSWPSDVSGLADLDSRRRRFRELTESVRFGPSGADGISNAAIGHGRVLRGDGLERALVRAGVGREPMVDLGLLFARRADAQGRFYFVDNRGDRAIDAWVPFRMTMPAATIFDPMSGRRGAARVRRAGADTVGIYLQLPPGESLIVAATPEPAEQRYEFYAPVGAAVSIAGPWSVRFIKGGPVLPPARSVETLQSWTMFGGDEVKSFSGTATYTATFPHPPAKAAAWQLDLGRVHESARVRLNGRDLGTLIGPAFRLTVDAAIFDANNTIEISVTNLSANRIADLDRRGVAWKKFYNVNMPARFPENRGPDGLFTAAKWEPLASGLVGPVTLTPLTPR